MKNQVKLLVVISLYAVGTFLLGTLYKIDVLDVLKILAFTVSFQYLCFHFSYKKEKSGLSWKASLARYKEFLKKSVVALVLLIGYTGYQILTQVPADILFFYSNVLLAFYSVGFIVCLNGLALKGETV